MTQAMTPFATPSSSSELWELVGLRIEGLEAPLIGATRFARQDAKSDARCSLAAMLSSHRRDSALQQDGYPRWLLRLWIKPEELSLIQLLTRLAGGLEVPEVLVDLGAVQVAFDFRSENPSLDESRFLDHARRPMYFRTLEGHVLHGVLHSPENRLNRSDPFIGISAVRQLTPMGPIPLPNLIVQRRYLSLAAEDDESGLERNPPFLASAGAQAPLIGAVAWRFFSRRSPAVQPFAWNGNESQSYDTAGANGRRPGDEVAREAS